jgi:hypothetical protein
VAVSGASPRANIAAQSFEGVAAVLLNVMSDLVHWQMTAIPSFFGQAHKHCVHHRATDVVGHGVGVVVP